MKFVKGDISFAKAHDSLLQRNMRVPTLTKVNIADLRFRIKEIDCDGPKYRRQ